MDIPEEENENEIRLLTKLNEVFKKQGVSIGEHDIIALHRIPTRRGGIKPILIKTFNNNVKSRIMRKRKEMKNTGHRLVDDETTANTGLISRLQQHPRIESAYYFNGAVYGITLKKCVSNLICMTI